MVRYLLLKMSSSLNVSYFEWMNNVKFRTGSQSQKISNVKRQNAGFEKMKIQKKREQTLQTTYWQTLFWGMKMEAS